MCPSKQIMCACASNAKSAIIERERHPNANDSSIITSKFLLPCPTTPSSSSAPVPAKTSSGAGLDHILLLASPFAYVLFQCHPSCTTIFFEFLVCAVTSTFEVLSQSNIAPWELIGDLIIVSKLGNRNVADLTQLLVVGSSDGRVSQ